MWSFNQENEDIYSKNTNITLEWVNSLYDPVINVSWRIADLVDMLLAEPEYIGNLRNACQHPTEDLYHLISLHTTAILNTIYTDIDTADKSRIKSG